MSYNIQKKVLFICIHQGKAVPLYGERKKGFFEIIRKAKRIGSPSPPCWGDEDCGGYLVRGSALADGLILFCAVPFVPVPYAPACAHGKTRPLWVVKKEKHPRAVAVEGCK